MTTALPTKEQAEQAQAFMIEQIHVPAFLEKLASHGIQPRNQAEVGQLVQLGAVLAHAESQGRIKSAQDTANPFLDHVMSRLVPQQPVNVDQLIKNSADSLVSQHDILKNAALIYGHAVAGGELASE